MKAIKQCPSITVFILLFLILSCSSQNKYDYHHNGLEVTPAVREFVARHNISGTDLEKVHKIIKVMHDRFLFIRADRKQIQSWIENPKKAGEFQNHVHQLKKELELLNQKRLTDPLSKEEYAKRKELQKSIFFGEHNLRIFKDVFSKKNIYPEDLPFVVSGAEAVEHKIQDGCTTATKTFIVLAKAAGLEELRFVPTGNTVNYNQA
jgi:hypothetical protein